MERYSHLELTLEFIREFLGAENISLEGSSLKIPQVFAVSSKQVDTKVDLGPSVVDEMNKNANYLRSILDQGQVIYGINTSYGGSADKRSSDLEQMQKCLTRLLNAGMGRTFPREHVRAAMVTRANCLSRAYSGIRPVVLQAMVELINHDITPLVPVRGSVGASGDLVPLSYVASTLAGRPDINVLMDNEEKPCREALEKAGIEPIVYGPKEGLAIANGCSFSAGIASCTLFRANEAVLLTQICTALAVEALRGHIESFHPLAYEVFPHVGHQEVADNVRCLLQGSQLATMTLEMDLQDTEGTLKQDRYALRTAPQWLSPVVETLKASCRRISIELNSTTDNPIIDHRTHTVISGGNFQGASISVTMDQTRQALQMCGKLLFAQFSEMVNHLLNYGLPPNMSGSSPNLDCGFKGADIAMSSYISELDLLTNPVTNHVQSAELNNQSVNSMCLLSVRKTEEALEVLQMMLANHLCLVTQAVDLRYLSMCVDKKLKEFGAKNPTAMKAVLSLPWYEFVFDPERVAASLALDAQSEKMMTDLMQDVNAMMKEMKEGEAKTGDKLGMGTRKVYHFIRDTLKVPFNHGQIPLDKSLQTILAAIQDGTVEKTLLETFSCVEPRTGHVKTN